MKRSKATKATKGSNSVRNMKKKPARSITKPARSQASGSRSKATAKTPPQSGPASNALPEHRKKEGVTDIGEAGADSEFEVKIQNIVAFTDLGTKVKLEKILQKLDNTEYQPEQFPGLIYRMQSPRASALVFSQGKIVCTGTKSMADLKAAMEQIVKNISSVGFALPKKYTTTVENIVASSAIKADLNLDEIAFQLENSEYEPEQFPGLVYRISQPRVAFLLFKSGRIIITGARTLAEIHEALATFKKNLEALGVKLKPSKSKT